MSNGENADEMPDDKLNPCGLALGNIAELDNEVVKEADGGDAAKRGGGDDIV